MQFTTVALAALASLASASAVPRADFGSWDVTWTTGSLTAVYTNTQLEAPITSTCTSEEGAAPVCEGSFRYTFTSDEQSQKSKYHHMPVVNARY